MINVPNVVTVVRVLIGLGAIYMLWWPGDVIRWAAFVITGFVIYADALDGYLARKLNQASKLGGILDIAGDRAVELCYWVAYSSLGWIPPWVPILFIIRGIFVDGIRSFASEQGYTAFGAKTMMQSGFGKFIVASNFSRFTYAVCKAIAFCLVIASHTELGAQYRVEPVAMFFVYASCVFCVIRGLPVLLESGGLFKHSPEATAARLASSMNLTEPEIKSTESDLAK